MPSLRGGSRVGAGRPRSVIEKTHIRVPIYQKSVLMAISKMLSLESLTDRQLRYIRPILDQFNLENPL
jgi:hypothetical protein